MNRAIKSFGAGWKLYLLLFFLSASIYGFYYAHLIANINSVLFTIDGDSLKNYYTFVYHTRNDINALEFTGLNFPFGEHIVYTDCQPLLSLILRLLPFTHDHLIGIMHAIILLSFMITPPVLMAIFKRIGLNNFSSFFSALSIGILSPQIQRFGGHFSLAYGCVIPLMVLFLLNYFKEQNLKNLLILFSYNSILFYLHPYFGFGASVFSFVSFLSFALFARHGSVTWNALKLFVIGLAPVLIFKTFMWITDHHRDRPTEPYGLDLMTANIESVFTPITGPFKHFLQQVVKVRGMEWEGYSYIGVFTFFLLVVYLILLAFNFKKVTINKQLLSLLTGAIVLLFFSFGVHNKILDILHLNIVFIRQFRALGRFAWYFYFMLPVFLLPGLIGLLRDKLSTRTLKVSMVVIPLLFFGFNMTEAHFYLRMMTKNLFMSRNVFNQQLLTEKEQKVLNDIQDKNLQAIIPLPLFHVGSEFYSRQGSESVSPAFIYSFHAKLPVLSVMLSRTSISETEVSLELLNDYKFKRKLESQLNSVPFLVIKTKDIRKPDELRLLKKLSLFEKYDSLEFYLAQRSDFSLPEAGEENFVGIPVLKISDTNKNFRFIPSENRMPFLPSNVGENAIITSVKSGELDAGEYIASIHYYYTQKNHRSGNNLIVTKTTNGHSTTAYVFPVLHTSGFYNGFIVAEEKIRIEEGSAYSFALQGMSDSKYRIANFLLRPEGLNVKAIQNGAILLNNYPRR